MAYRSKSNMPIDIEREPHELPVLEALYRRYGNEIRRYVARHFGLGPPEPDDVVQAAFENLASAPNLAELDNPYTFLVRCTRNYVVDQHRRAKVRADHMASESCLETEIDDLHAERVISSRQRYEIMACAIGSLDERRREMLLMNRVEGLSYAEVARRKGCSVTLVKLLVAEALAACHEALDRAEGDQ